MFKQRVTKNCNWIITYLTLIRNFKFKHYFTANMMSNYHSCYNVVAKGTFFMSLICRPSVYRKFCNNH